MIALALLAATIAGHAAAASQEEHAFACDGKGPSELELGGGRPFSRKLRAMSGPEAKSFEIAGYRFGPSGRIIDAAGRELSESDVDRLRSPFDAASRRIEPGVWLWITTSYSVRPDPRTCFLMTPEGEPLSLLNVEAFERAYDLGVQKSTLELLRSELRRLPPGKALSGESEAKFRRLAAGSGGLARRIAALLGDGRKTAGELLAGADAAYREARDEQVRLGAEGELIRKALPPVEGVTYDRPYPDTRADEKGFSRTLTADVETVLSKTPAGRSLLDRLKAGGGRLPDLQLAKLTQREQDGHTGAVALHGDAVVLNHWQALMALRQLVPEADRPALEAAGKDAARLRRYLAARPALRKRLIERFDDLYVHELTHTLQARSNGVEHIRDNTPGQSLTKEYEAYREQCVYIFQRAELDAEYLVRNPIRHDCLTLLRGYDEFERGIREPYQRDYFGQKDMCDVIALHESRERDARGGGFAGWLRRLGLARGRLQLDAEKARDDADVAAFKEKGLPEMRRRVKTELAPRLGAADRPEIALMLLRHLPPPADERAAAALASASERLLLSGKLPFERRKELWRELLRVRPIMSITGPLRDALDVDALDIVAETVRVGRENPTLLADAMAASRSWRDAIADPDKRTRADAAIAAGRR